MLCSIESSVRGSILLYFEYNIISYYYHVEVERICVYLTAFLNAYSENSHLHKSTFDKIIFLSCLSRFNAITF